MAGMDGILLGSTHDLTRAWRHYAQAQPTVSVGSKCEILTASRCFPLCSQHRTLFGSVVHGRLRLPRGQSVTPLREKRGRPQHSPRVLFFELARFRAVGQKASLGMPQAGARPRWRTYFTRRFSADSLPRFGTISNVTLAPSGRPSRPAFSTAEI
jgi:hypothetical protein